jgi:hypothetical protein
MNNLPTATIFFQKVDPSIFADMTEKSEEREQHT